MNKHNGPKIVLVDIDDTLVDAKWREQFMPTRIDGGAAKPEEWDLYNAKSVDDRPLGAMLDLIAALELVAFEIWGVTSRPEKWRDLTEATLARMGSIPFDLLLMRPNDEVTVPSPILKPALVIKELRKRYGASYTKASDYIALALEDRADVCEAYRGIGILCLQVHSIPKENPNG